MLLSYGRFIFSCLRQPAPPLLMEAPLCHMVTLRQQDQPWEFKNVYELREKFINVNLFHQYDSCFRKLIYQAQDETDCSALTVCDNCTQTPLYKVSEHECTTKYINATIHRHPHMDSGNCILLLLYKTVNLIPHCKHTVLSIKFIAVALF